MSESIALDSKRTPRHLWVVGIFALLWSGGGAFDYVMSQTRNEEYLSQFTPEQLEFFFGIPTWAVATWALAVWAGVAGALLLLFRRRTAVGVFLVSLIAMVITTFQNYVLSNGMEVMGDAFSLGFTAAIFLFSLGFYLYARAMDKQKILT